MTRVERGLPAANLLARELDVEAGAAKERLGVGDGVREDEIADAGGKKLDAIVQALRYGTSSRRPVSLERTIASHTSAAR